MVEVAPRWMCKGNGAHHVASGVLQMPTSTRAGEQLLTCTGLEIASKDEVAGFPKWPMSVRRRRQERLGCAEGGSQHTSTPAYSSGPGHDEAQASTREVTACTEGGSQHTSWPQCAQINKQVGTECLGNRNSLKINVSPKKPSKMERKGNQLTSEGPRVPRSMRRWVRDSRTTRHMRSEQYRSKLR